MSERAVSLQPLQISRSFIRVNSPRPYIKMVRNVRIMTPCSHCYYEKETMRSLCIVYVHVAANNIINIESGVMET
jgi:hypothetical protein